MMDLVSHAYARLHRLGLALAVVACAGLLAAGVAKGVILGAGAKAKPACPTSPCQAVGKVTGFQKTINGERNPFVAPSNGRITEWSVKLSTPDSSQTDFFTKFYGGAPQAQLAILRRSATSRGVFQVRSVSPLMNLSNLLGKVRTFALKPALSIKKREIVGIAIPTWAPMFGIGLANSNSWVGSRRKGNCETPEQIQAGTAHTEVGSERAYGCAYRTARLLYSANFKPTGAKKQPANGKQPAKQPAN
jgi:hypothetical protein